MSSAVGDRIRRALARGVSLLFALFAAGGAWAQAPEPQLFGKTIVSLGYTCDGPVRRADVEQLLELKAGQPLMEEGTGATIRNLYATGRFANVEIEAEVAQGGVSVVIHLFRFFRVSPLRFSGAPLSVEELRRVLLFSEGAAFDAKEMEEGASAVRRRLLEEGYLHARVSPEVFFHRETFDAEVTYRVEAGDPARVAGAFFDGDLAPFTREQLLKDARLDPGDRYRESKARADAVRMTEFLHRNSRLKGSIELIAAQPTPDGRIAPVYRASVGPKVIFEARGVNVRKAQRDVHDLIEGQGFDEDLILQYVENKRRELQREGHYRAKVDYSMTPGPDTIAVSITVEKGSRFEVQKVDFAGNESVKDKTLSALMLTRRKGLPFLQPGHLVDQELSDDLSNILGYYQAHGWINARVDKPRMTEGSSPDRLVVTIPIQEGPRTRVATRKIVGAEHVASSDLEKALTVQTGQPLNPSEARQDVYSLQTFYRDRGWREVSVKDEITLSPDQTRADIAYQVEEGPRSFFGKVIVSGNTRTDTGRIRRLVTWREGKPFSEAEVIQTQRKLTSSGVFRRVEVRPQPTGAQTQASNVGIKVEEGRPFSLLYGLGYQFAPDALENQHDPFVVGGVSYNNLFGTMRSVGVEGQVSLSRRFRAQVSFREPFLFGKDYKFTSLLFATREPIQEIDLERLGFVNEISHYYGRYLRAGFRVEYQRIRAVNPQSLSIIEQKKFPRFDRPIEEATVGPTLLYDRRDDIIDPHHGYYLTGVAKYAFPVWKAQARYTKISGQATHFAPVGRNVLAISARAGAIFPYGPSDIPVPIAERFFAGGRSSNRAFDTDVVGIPGSTVDYGTRATLHQGKGEPSCGSDLPDLAGYDCDFGPRIIGGNGMLGFNAEFRFPIAGDFGGSVFYDAAQIWKKVSDIHLRLGGIEGLRQGVGVGLWFMLPFGPLRAEYAWKLDPQTIFFDVIDAKTGAPLSRGSTKEKSGKFFVSIGFPF